MYAVRYGYVTVWVTVSLRSVIIYVLLTVERRNNFPPLPGWFPIKPCFYQDFDLEIPVEFQHLVRTMYRLWQGEHGYMYMVRLSLCAKYNLYMMQEIS